jgi:YfiH family protein
MLMRRSWAEPRRLAMRLVGLWSDFLKPDFPQSWLRPEWPAPANVQAVMTDRQGGVSERPYDRMNLGDHVGDRADAVLHNRVLLQTALDRRPVFLQQVHGIQNVLVNTDTPDGTVADACIATSPDVACTIMVADCLPVLLCDASGQWVAAAHAGWRGLAGQRGVGVLEQLLATLQDIQALVQPVRGNILAWLGPCIGPQAFEVGPEVFHAFGDQDTQAKAFFAPQAGGKYRADLAGLARLRLNRLGITQIYGNNSQASWCTVNQPSSFFSHRRDSRFLGQSGRMAACIWLDR